MEMEEIQRNLNNTETNVQHNSATTHTHKAQYLHTAVGANRVCNSARAVVAYFIVDLRDNADERWRWGKFSKTETNTETNVQHNSATTHTHKGQLPHTAVGAHRVGDGARAVVAEVIVVL